MWVVDCLKILLDKQHHTYLTALDQTKIRVAFNLPRDFMRDLIARVTPYCLHKLLKQWALVQKAIKELNEYLLKPCTKAFTTTLSLPCAHIIQERLNTTSKLLLDDVHSHWRFKKPESLYLEPLFRLATELDPPFVDDEDDDSDFLTTNELLYRLSNRIEPLPAPAKSDLEEDELLDVNEPQTNKLKGRLKGSQNRKGLMTRITKKAVRSTRRDPSAYELVERTLKIRSQTNRGRGSRGGRRKGHNRGENRGGKRGRRSDTTIKEKATASQLQEISSDIESDVTDDGFNDLINSDEEFEAPVDLDEDPDVWMD